MEKYSLKFLSNIIISIVENKETHLGIKQEEIVYTNLPTNMELMDWSDQKMINWIGENNLRMKKLCRFMNSEEFSKA